MRKILFIICFFNITNLFGQCSVTFTTSPDYCASCTGSINSTPTGQPPFSFSWSSGQTTQNISGLCAGVYTLTVTDSNLCSTTASVPINNPGGFAFVTGTDATCSGCCDGTGDITISAGTPPYIYLWCDGQTTSSVTGLCAGTCFIQVTDSMGCTFFLTLTTNEPPTGINESNCSSSILLYPNPTNQFATIEFNNPTKQNFTLTLYDLRGQLLRTMKNITTEKVEIERQNLVTHTLDFRDFRAYLLFFYFVRFHVFLA